MNKLNGAMQQEAQHQLLEVVNALEARQVNFIDGIRRITSLRSSVSTLDHDPDFSIFVAVDSESDHLPGLEQRKHCTPAWLEKCELEAKQIETFWGDKVSAACRVLVTRFSN